MVQTNFEKIIDTLLVTFVKAEHIEVLKPVKITHDQSIHNRIIFLHQGSLTIHTPKEDYVLASHTLYFLPAGTIVSITYGREPKQILPKDSPSVAHYLDHIEPTTPTSVSTHLFSVLFFDVKAYNALDFFKFIGLPTFCIPDAYMHKLAKGAIEESQQMRLGKQQLLNSYMTSFMVMLLRYLVAQRMFLETISIRIEALMDKRLIEIFTYIARHLKEDLSNAAIADHVGLSREYIGQFFRKNTHTNLQSYIKTTRISKAIELLAMTPPKKIQTICQEVGIHDFAYFCRILKKAIGITARQVQKRARGLFPKHP